MKKGNKKLLAWVLSFVMLFGCFARTDMVKAEEGDASIENERVNNGNTWTTYEDLSANERYVITAAGKKVDVSADDIAYLAQVFDTAAFADKWKNANEGIEKKFDNGTVVGFIPKEDGTRTVVVEEKETQKSYEVKMITLKDGLNLNLEFTVQKKGAETADTIKVTANKVSIIHDGTVIVKVTKGVDGKYYVDVDKEWAEKNNFVLKKVDQEEPSTEPTAISTENPTTTPTPTVTPTAMPTPTPPLTATAIPKKTHQIVYKDGEAEAEMPEDAVKTYTEGTAVTLSNPKDKDGYEFKGWYTDADFAEDTKITAVGGQGEIDDVIVYAKWEEIKTYTVTFDSKGGSPVKPITVKEGEVVTKPANPKKENHSFAGWYMDEGCTVEYKFDQALTGNTTIYAKWWKLITVVFKNGSDEARISFFENQGVSANEFPTPQRQQGKVFLGWYDTSDGKEVPYTEVKAGSASRDIILMAKWADLSIPDQEIFVPKKDSKGKKIDISSNIDKSRYTISYQWYELKKNKEQVLANETGASFAAKADQKGTATYFCEVTVKTEGFISVGRTQILKVTGYEKNISMTLYKSKNFKTITEEVFGAKRNVSSFALKKESKKYLKLEAKKSRVRISGYNKKKKKQQGILIVTVDGQKLEINVNIKFPKPKIKVKGGKRIKTYIEGRYRTYKVTYSNIKGATKIVAYVGKNKKSFKKAPKSICKKKKNIKISVKAGARRYLKIVAYYGKGKSPESKIKKLGK